MFYFQQLVEGVEYCHNLGVCHRDLSKFPNSGIFQQPFIDGYLFIFLEPENLLLDEYSNLKISDFGLSSLYVGDADSDGASRTELLHTTCGTPNYVAPEVLADEGYDGKKADVWSCGVILYVLLAGFLPFDEQTIVALFQKIKCADFTYPSWFSNDVRSLLDTILVANPQNRISLTDLKHHQWMKWSERVEPLPSVVDPPPQIRKDIIPDDSETALDDDEDEDKVNGTSASPEKAARKLKSSAKLLGAKRFSESPVLVLGNKVLNAFDLVNQCGGFALDRLLICRAPPLSARESFSGEHGDTLKRFLGKNHHQFASGIEPEELLRSLSQILLSMGFTIHGPSEDYETEQSFSQRDHNMSALYLLNKTKIKAAILTPKGTIGLNAYAFVLTGSLTLLEIRRGKGDILGFYRIFNDLISKIKHLVRL